MTIIHDGTRAASVHGFRAAWIGRFFVRHLVTDPLLQDADSGQDMLQQFRVVHLFERVGSLGTWTRDRFDRIATRLQIPLDV